MNNINKELKKQFILFLITFYIIFCTPKVNVTIYNKEQPTIKSK